MRYDTAIFFQRYPEPIYDSSTGDYEMQLPVEVMRMANVTEVGDNNVSIESGKVYERNVVIRLQTPYTKDFDVIRINNTVYTKTKSQTLRSKQTIVAKEVQNVGADNRA